jgi:hypothetical protein
MDSGNGIPIAAASQASQPATPRVRRMQIAALTLLVTSGAVNYVDRATLAIGNPLIRADPHLSVAGMGLLLSAFLWAHRRRRYRRGHPRHLRRMAPLVRLCHYLGHDHRLFWRGVPHLGL